MPPKTNKIAKLDYLANKEKSIFADKTVRENYLKAKKWLCEETNVIRVNAECVYYPTNRLVSRYFVYYNEELIANVIKEIKLKPSPKFRFFEEENVPGLWFCSCKQFSNQKICEHIFLVVLKWFKNPAIILKDKFYSPSKYAIKKSNEFLENIIKQFPDKIKILSHQEILVNGKLSNYVITITKNRIYIYGSKFPYTSYCIIPSQYPTLLTTPYPLEDILAAVILFLLNDDKKLTINRI